MKADFPYLEVPADLIFGRPDAAGTRIYRRQGSDEEHLTWLVAVSTLCNNALVSPGMAWYFVTTSNTVWVLPSRS
jgi:hypothetical protein